MAEGGYRDRCAFRGRVIDQNWINTSTGTSVSRFQYGYDEDGNVLYKNDLVTPTNSELYSYDDLNRLTNYEAVTERFKTGHLWAPQNRPVS